MKSRPQHYSLKASVLQCSAFFMVQLSHPHMTTGKTMALTICTFVSKVISLLFNMLSTFVIGFHPRSKCILISWLQSLSAVILEPQKRKSLFPNLFAMKGWDLMPWSQFFECWVLNLHFHSPLSPSSRVSSASLFAISVVVSTYMRLLIFLLAILIPACDSSSPAFCMTYSVYKLNKQGDNIQPWRTPFPSLNQPIVPCPVLTVASCLAYRFLRRQVSYSGFPISLRIFHSLLWSTQSKALA